MGVTNISGFFMIKEGILRVFERKVMNQIHLVVVGQADRKKDNLISMLESVKGIDSIEIVEGCGEVEKAIVQETPAIVLMDYRNPMNDTDKKISELYLNKNVEHVVLLKSHNSPDTHFTHFSTSEVFYDELSTELLTSLFKNIQRSR